jgi:PQQ-dependent catabolism-associated CXXCW motif protein
LGGLSHPMPDHDQILAPPRPGQTELAGADFVTTMDMSDEPYPGLRSFWRDETHIFFGREGTINEMVDRLAAHRFLAVTGASGSGKSSLVRTGLLDALDRGLLAEAGPDWSVADFPPGDHPIAALTNALVAAIGGTFSDDERAVIGARLLRGPRGLIDWLDEIKFPLDANLLVLVDQFEELFRYRGRNVSDEAEAFVALLLKSVAQRDRRIYVVITMRSDFLGECARFFGLADAINDGQFLTPRLTRQQCQQAIEGPARVCGGRVEKALVTRLLNDMGSNPDQLPLMQHILMLMWQKARQLNPADIALTLADYENLGGIGSGASAESAGAIGGSAVLQPQAEGALSKHADQTLRELTSEQQRLAGILFRALVQTEGNIGRDVRRPVSLRQVASIAEANPDDLLPIVEAFRAPGRNFLRPAPPAPIEPDTVIDISHESLIRQWGTLRKWSHEEFESAKRYRHVEATAKFRSKHEADLLRKLDLDSALDWRQRERPNAAWASRYGGDFDLAMRFLDASQKSNTARRWLAFSMGCCVVVGLIAFSLYQYRAAKLNKEEAQRSAEALRQAEINYGVPPQTNLREGAKMNSPTPLTVPGGTVLRTPELVELTRKEQDVTLIDALPGSHSTIPNAVRIPYAGEDGSLGDKVQRRLKARLDNLTHDNLDAKLVIFCSGASCWHSYNACLRAMNAGYRQVFWYRDGLHAWTNEEHRPREGISQSVKTIEQRLSTDAAPREAWNDAVSLSEAAAVLLGSPPPDNGGALAAASRARDVLQSLRSRLSDNPDFLNDLAGSNVQLAQIYAKQDDFEGELASYREAETIRRKFVRAAPADLNGQYDLADVLFQIGESLKRQKKYDKAMLPYNEAQEIWQTLVNKQPNNRDWLLQLMRADYSIGGNLENQNKLDDALNTYRAVRDLARELVDDKPDSSNDPVEYLQAAFYQIGLIFDSKNMKDGAIANYSSGVEIINKVIDKEPTNLQWRHDFSDMQDSMGDALKTQGKLDLALVAYQAAANSAKFAISYNENDTEAQYEILQAGSDVGKLAYEFVLAHRFAKAFETADIADSLIPGRVWIQANRAHALMFLGRIAEAQNIYLKFRGQKSSGDKSWEANVSSDFADLRKHGLSNPLMAEIKKQFRASK